MVVNHLPVWTYAIKKFKKLQMLQNITLTICTNSHYFVKNETLHNDLQIPYLSTLVIKLADSFFMKAESHFYSELTKATMYNASVRTK